MPSTIQTAIIFESLINLIGIIPLIFFPSSTLSRFAVAPTQATTTNPTMTLLARIIGLFIAALTFGLLSAYPITPLRVEKRKLIYFTLGAGEALFMPLFLWEAIRASDAEKIAQGGGFSRRMSLMCAGNLVPPLAWRVWVWTGRPHWFDGYDRKEGEKMK